MNGDAEEGRLQHGGGRRVLAASAIRERRFPPRFSDAGSGLDHLALGWSIVPWPDSLPAAFMAVWLMILIHSALANMGCRPVLVVPGERSVRATLIANSIACGAWCF